MLRITVFGAGGRVGARVVAEALARGHRVTAVVRDAARPAGPHPGAVSAVGDASDPAAVEALSADADVVVGAIRPAPGREHELAPVAAALLKGTAAAGSRLLLVGGAGSLLLPDGTALADSPDFPPDWLPIARACDEQLAVCRAAHEGDWAYLSPAALLEPGARTGRFRLGGDALLTDAAGVSALSMEDLAVALLDEAEHPRHHNTRFTAAY
ncbi:NAD(P)-dependent oxidoreductase [Streptomyces sp. NPDC050560]|uniref:NAD(P)-dependent oxidoreductase n=1 Tax=Streptomyces sp. NPDC050560 TaxID=3365630 RepID=UPI0037908D47